MASELQGKAPVWPQLTYPPLAGRVFLHLKPSPDPWVTRHQESQAGSSLARRPQRRASLVASLLFSHLLTARQIELCLAPGCPRGCVGLTGAGSLTAGLGIFPALRQQERERPGDRSVDGAQAGSLGCCSLAPRPPDLPLSTASCGSRCCTV